jgi:hypothetical protein
LSKSLAQVRAAQEAAGVAFDLRETADGTRTAEQARQQRAARRTGS